MTQTENALQKWLDGKMSLGAAANWEKSEIRIISEVAYSLAQQGRNLEAVVLFEGLLTIAPATAYFQAALGALLLRTKNFSRAIEHLDAALKIEPGDIVSLVNRGEAKLRGGSLQEARIDLENATQRKLESTSKKVENNEDVNSSLRRACALLEVYRD